MDLLIKRVGSFQEGQDRRDNLEPAADEGEEGVLNFDLFSDDVNMLQSSEEYIKAEVLRKIEAATFIEDIAEISHSELCLALDHNNDDNGAPSMDSLLSTVAKTYKKSRRPSTQVVLGSNVIDHCILSAYCLTCDEEEVVVTQLDSCNHRICDRCFEGWILNECIGRSASISSETWRGEISCPACTDKRTIELDELRRYISVKGLPNDIIERFTRKLIEATFTASSMKTVRCPNRLEDGSFCDFPIILETDDRRQLVTCRACHERQKEGNPASFHQMQSFSFCSLCRERVSNPWDLRTHECQVNAPFADSGVMHCPHCSTIIMKEEDMQMMEVTNVLGVEAGNGACNKLTCTKCYKCSCWVCQDKSKDYDHFNDPSSVCNLWDIVVNVQNAHVDVRVDKVVSWSCRHSAFPSGISHYLVFDPVSKLCLAFDRFSKPVRLESLADKVGYQRDGTTPMPSATLAVIDVDRDKGIVTGVRGPKGPMTFEQSFRVMRTFIHHRFPDINSFFKNGQMKGKQFFILRMRENENKDSSEGETPKEMKWTPCVRKIERIVGSISTAQIEEAIKEGWHIQDGYKEKLLSDDASLREWTSSRAPVLLECDNGSFVDFRFLQVRMASSPGPFDLKPGKLGEYCNILNRIQHLSYQDMEKESPFASLCRRSGRIREAISNDKELRTLVAVDILNKSLGKLKEDHTNRYGGGVEFDDGVAAILRDNGHVNFVYTPGPTLREMLIHHYARVGYEEFLVDIKSKIPYVEATTEGMGEVDPRAKERELAQRFHEEHQRRAEERRRERERFRMEMEARQRRRREKEPEMFFGNLFDERDMEQVQAEARKVEERKRKREEKGRAREDDWDEILGGNLFDGIDFVANVVNKVVRPAADDPGEMFKSLLAD